MWKITNSSECRATLELFWCIGCHSTVLSIKTFIWGPCLWFETLECRGNFFHESFVGILSIGFTRQSSWFIQVIFSHWNWININFYVCIIRMLIKPVGILWWYQTWLKHFKISFVYSISVHVRDVLVGCTFALHVRDVTWAQFVKKSTRLVATII